MSSVEVVQVDAAMVKHLSDEVARLEAENKTLREALDRPVYVTITAAPTPAVTNYHEQGMLTATQGINNSLSMLSFNLQEIRNHLIQP